MFEDTLLTVILLSMIVLMIFGLFAVNVLNKDTRHLEEQNRARKAKHEKGTARPS
jgi:F0F1-type ATP synthase assembly protein I